MAGLGTAVLFDVAVVVGMLARCTTGARHRAASRPAVHRRVRQHAARWSPRACRRTRRLVDEPRRVCVTIGGSPGRLPYREAQRGDRHVATWIAWVGTLELDVGIDPCATLVAAAVPRRPPAVSRVGARSPGSRGLSLVVLRRGPGLQPGRSSRPTSRTRWASPAPPSSAAMVTVGWVSCCCRLLGAGAARRWWFASGVREAESASAAEVAGVGGAGRPGLVVASMVARAAVLERDRAGRHRQCAVALGLTVVPIAIGLAILR